jgi:hypothetical protein
MFKLEVRRDWLMISKIFGEIITKQTLQTRAKSLGSIGLCAFTIVAITSAFAMQQNNEFPTTSHECTQVTLDDIDESLLTKEEKLARLDVSLSDSIDSYTTCVNTVQQQMSGGGSGGNSGGGGGTGEQGVQSASGGVQSAAGNEQSQEKKQIGQQQSGGSQAGSSAVKQSQNTTTNVKRGVLAPKDNDSIICKLLYEEIQKANADSLAGLEKQYQDYKCGK